ncbi:hypothetical protein VTL71DRAFT_12814 [Oculimacula yallundae]|uniref:Uncharacterized protein n=1 Tax=Oculimacula yallundae TaxID=86028 RepID=A0ABR4CP29_9HELO
MSTSLAYHYACYNDDDDLAGITSTIIYDTALSHHRILYKIARAELTTKNEKRDDAVVTYSGLLENTTDVVLRIPEYTVDSASAALEGAQLQVEIEEANVANANSGVAPRESTIRRSRKDLVEGDFKALLLLVEKAWVAAGGRGNFSDDFGNQFLDDVFAGGWTSEFKAFDNPQEPSSNDMPSYPVSMGRLRKDCDGTAKAPEPKPHRRRAGAEVKCRVSKDATKLLLEYVDINGSHIKYEQEDADGRKYVNIHMAETIEGIQARANLAWEAGETARFGPFNRMKILNEARASLHHWYHVGAPYDNVPHLDFEPQQLPSGDSICSI